MSQSYSPPVIAAIGQVIDRNTDAKTASHPAQLIGKAVKSAGAESGVEWGAALSQIDVINISSWRYADLAGEVQKAVETQAPISQRPTGGQTPVLAVAEAAQHILEHPEAVVAIAGAEAQYTVRQNAKVGIALDWPEKTSAPPDFMALFSQVSPQTAQSGLLIPANAYPLYENAQTYYAGSPRAAHESNAALWAEYSAVAAQNPYSWDNAAKTAEAIARPGPGNRLIAYPYTKSMVANPNVNQGAAIILCSEAKALALGVAPNHLIYIGDGAKSDEPADILARRDYTSCPSIDAVLDALPGAFDMAELYSCFPIVPQMIRRARPSLARISPTAAGGLSFFGAPLNNYMTHGICALTAQLRKTGGTALAYGLGEYLTKHCALVLQSSRPDQFPQFQDITASSKAAHKDAPSLSSDYSGPATLETFTITFDRNGQPETALLILRSANGQYRLLAGFEQDDAAAMARLLDPKRSPVGAKGTASAQNGKIIFRFE